MRLLYINSQLVDIDETTSIGIDYQAYDIKEPGKRKTIISNTFSIPKTAHNLAVFGFPDNPQSTSDIVYDKITANYWIDNNHIIIDGSVRIEEITERINLYVTNKNSIWDKLKLLTWNAFENKYIAWAKNVKGFPVSQPTSNNFSTFISNFINSTDGIILPFYYGNFLNGDNDQENKTKIILNDSLLSTDENYLYGGGHFCIFVKSVFEFLEYEYSINFCTQETGITGNIWDDTIAQTLYTPARDYYVYTYVSSPGGIFQIDGFEISSVWIYPYFTKPIFNPLNDVIDKEDKTLYDFVLAFLMKFNAIVDEINLSDGTKAIRIARFDDIETLATVKDFSKKIQSVTSFKPSLAGYAQNNLIKIKALYPGASEIFGSRNLTCLNKNLEVTTDLFSIDEYIANFKAITDDVIPDLSIQESFKTFEFFVNNGTSTDSITINYYYREESSPGVITTHTLTTTANLKIPAHYDLSGEYLFLEEIIQKPKVYTIKKYLSITDIFNIEFFAQYYIRRLNGSFYINKISGFNPQKSTEPTTIEVIRVSSKTATPTYPDLNYFVDGIGNKFTDGVGGYFY
jgi:hypothetical protein